MDNEEKIKELEEENIILKQKLDDKTTQLNKYLLKNTNYYETHKEEHKQNVKEYQLKTNYKSNYIPTPEQKKKWARRAYLKRKEKIKQEIDENSKSGNI